MEVTTSVRKGGSWLLEDTAASDVFTPEKKSDEHRLMAQTTDEFIGNEVLPNLDKLETKDWDLARKLIRRCGELGLLGTDVPEEYGGLDLDKVSSLIVAEHIARSASFATTYGGDALDTGTTVGSARQRPASVGGGATPRNGIVGEPIHRVDLRLQKHLAINGRVGVDGIVEVFNVFNHANYGSYTTVESNRQYGQPSSNTNVAYQPRMVQLGFRFVF